MLLDTPTWNGALGLLALLFVLYAEIHYSLPGIYSRLKHGFPEIIADAPHRIQPGMPLPILVLIKDADKFPVHINTVSIMIKTPGGPLRKAFAIDERVKSRYWQRVIQIDSVELRGQKVFLDVNIEISRKGKTETVRNDNYRLTSHAALTVLISRHPLPKQRGWHFGEFHCHTSFTNDQVEFGAPLEATRTLARMSGLAFYCATDHSYDLDDQPDDFLKKDANLTKWHELWAQTLKLNEGQRDFVIIPGEEVSAGNCKGQNVHFLILNNPLFLPGEGDSAERWLKTKPTNTIAEVLSLTNSNSAAFAAHPEIRPSLLERLLVRRGHWRKADYAHAGLHGLQIWNGNNNGFDRGKESWIKLLLDGRRLFIAAGNDAHGNFNRFRQIRFPFFTMRENHHNLFGKIRTAVYVKGDLTLDNLLRAIKRGNMIVTDGPFLNLSVSNRKGDICISGDSISAGTATIRLACLSSPEFGTITDVKVYKGQLGQEREEMLVSSPVEPCSYTSDYRFDLQNITAKLYVRAELYSERGMEKFKCLSNPIWIDPL